MVHVLHFVVKNFKYKTNMGILSIVIEVNAELNGEEKVLQL